VAAGGDTSSGGGASGSGGGTTGSGGGSASPGGSGDSGTAPGGDTAGGGSTALVAPDAVAGLNANVEEQRLINLVWPNAARAARYDLYWSTTPGLSVQTAQRIENVQSPFKHQGLLGGLEYFYIVQAVNAAGVSAPSSEVSATLPPGAVSGLSVTSGDSAIGLTWIEPPYAQQYRIYWANSLGSLQSNPAVINAGSPPFIHTGLQNGTPYYYALAPVGSAGEGPVSQPVSAQPQTPVPNSPRLLSAAMNPDDSSSAILLWQAPEVPVNPEDILYFQIYRSVEPNFANNLTPTNQLVRTSAGFFIDSVPVTGIPYYYRVTAVTAAGEGAPSSEVSVTLSGASEDSSSGISNPHGGVFDCGEPTHCWQYGLRAILIESPGHASGWPEPHDLQRSVIPRRSCSLTGFSK
jgi:hypothetical protein